MPGGNMIRLRITSSVLALAAMTILATPALPQQASAPFRFAAIGDTGYSKKSEAEFDRMLAAMNREPLAFVLHVGDFQADPRPYNRSPDRISMPCTDTSFASVLKQFQSSQHPLILTPGDNDWTDCHLLKDRKVDPLERLEKLRSMFFPQGRSLGARAMAVTHQPDTQRDFSKFRENLAWTFNNTAFVTLHIVGSNDNKGRTTDMDTEAEERTKANLSWLKHAFASAKSDNRAGLVIVTQANPGFETHWTPSLKDRYFRLLPGVNPPKETKPSGFDPLLNAIEAEMRTYDKPVLFIHGDTHIFHVNKPLVSKTTQRFVDNFTRLEVFGDPESHWVRISVDPANPELFSIEPRIVPENRAGR